MAKPSNKYTVPKYVLKHLDANIARLEKSQAERQTRIDSLREMRARLMGTHKDKDMDDDT